MKKLLINGIDFSEMLTPGEAARTLKVDPKTVTRWAAAGKLPHVRLPGGHRRYSRAVVEAVAGGEDVAVPLTAKDYASFFDAIGNALDDWDARRISSDQFIEAVREQVGVSTDWLGDGS